MTDNQYNITAEAVSAESRIRKYIRETPLEYSQYLSKLGHCRVYLKMENLQITGSFKYRGAANHILSLTHDEKEKGIITASTGNHAAACAHVLNQFDIMGTIYLPENVSKAKLENLKFYNVELKFHGTDCIDTETFARKTAEKHHQVYIPPYNHSKIIAGQATIGIELKRQLEKMDSVLVPVGGGGLISGIAGYLKNNDNSIEIIGCQPENSPVMNESIKQGHIIDMQSLPTLSDGTAGGMEKNSLTFEFCKRYVDDYILVSEYEIQQALLLIIEKHQMLIEGAAALSVASFLKSKDQYAGKNIVLILSGNKLSMEKLRALIDETT